MFLCPALHAAQGIAVRSFNGSLLYEPWDAQPDASTDACWNSGYGSVRFFTSACTPLGPPGPPLEAPARLRGLRPEMRPRVNALGVVLRGLGLVDLPKRRTEECEWV